METIRRRGLHCLALILTLLLAVEGFWIMAWLTAQKRGIDYGRRREPCDRPVKTGASRPGSLAR